MNIFHLDEDVVVSAMYHNNRHDVKMILELAQLLCSAHHSIGSTFTDIYKKTHYNHPCAIWVRECVENYNYTYNLFCALCDEYKFRYGKTHLTDTKMRVNLKNINLPSRGKMTFPPLCISDNCKKQVSSFKDVIECYREYYRVDKAHLAEWKNRNKPEWY
jgi:hypothetical protein